MIKEIFNRSEIIAAGQVLIDSENSQKDPFLLIQNILEEIAPESRLETLQYLGNSPHCEDYIFEINKDNKATDLFKNILGAKQLPSESLDSNKLSISSDYIRYNYQDYQIAEYLAKNNKFDSESFKNLKNLINSISSNKSELISFESGNIYFSKELFGSDSLKDSLMIFKDIYGVKHLTYDQDNDKIRLNLPARIACDHTHSQYQSLISKASDFHENKKLEQKNADQTIEPPIKTGNYR